MATIHPIDMIASDPAVRGGQPIILGTTIRVIDLISSYLYRGLDAEELAVNYQLDLGQVHAALAYYYQHKSEIDQSVRDEASRSAELLKGLDQQGKLIRIE